MIPGRLHAADTLKEGYWLNEPDLVETLAREAPGRIEDLLRWGAELARDENGKVLQRFFGAHRYRWSGSSLQTSRPHRILAADEMNRAS